jgi:hypothetical protein
VRKISKFLSGLLLAFAAVFNSSGAETNQPPTSAEQLRSELETALNAKDTKAVVSLFNWDGVSENDKGMTLDMFIWGLDSEHHNLLVTNVTSVQLSPLSTNLQAMVNDEKDWQGDNGRRVKFSIPALGEIDVSTPTGEKIQLPFGKKGDFFYLAAFIAYQAPGMPLRVRVLGRSTYTGSWVYVTGGKEVTVNISDRTNQFRAGWGDYIKSCTVQKTSDAGTMDVDITEDGKNVFQAHDIETKSLIAYEPPAPAKPLQKHDDADDKSRELPVDASYQMGDDCVLVLKSSAKEKLSLTVTAINWTSNRTNACQVDLAGGETKEVDLLAGWIFTPDDRVQFKIVNPKYDPSYLWITYDHTPIRKIAEQPQEIIFQAFGQTQNQLEKGRDAQVLSDFWRASLLKDEIKEPLVQEHYEFVLRQRNMSGGGISALEMRCNHTFPFPDVHTTFTPILYVNDKVSSPDERETLVTNRTVLYVNGKVASPDEEAAWATRNGPINRITHQNKWPSFQQGTRAMNGTVADVAMFGGNIGGNFKNGDVLQCKMDLEQTVNGHSWKTSLLSNKIVLQGLKE